MRSNAARVGVLHPSGSEASAVPASLAFPSKAAPAKRSMTPGSVRKFWLSASLRWIDACARGSSFQFLHPGDNIGGNRRLFSRPISSEADAGASGMLFQCRPRVLNEPPSGVQRCSITALPHAGHYECWSPCRRLRSKQVFSLSLSGASGLSFQGCGIGVAVGRSLGVL